MSVRLFKKRDVTESRYGQNISSSSSSRKLGQVDDQGMRDGKGFILSGIHVTTGRRVRSIRVRENDSKHDKGTINHQL